MQTEVVAIMKELFTGSYVYEKVLFPPTVFEASRSESTRGSALLRKSDYAFDLATCHKINSPSMGKRTL